MDLEVHGWVTGKLGAWDKATHHGGTHARAKDSALPKPGSEKRRS